MNENLKLRNITKHSREDLTKIKKQVKNILGDNIKKYRKRNYYSKDIKLTQEAVADLTGISRAHFSDIERGRVNTTVDRLVEIAFILDVDIEDLFTVETAEEMAQATFFREAPAIGEIPTKAKKVLGSEFTVELQKELENIITKAVSQLLTLLSKTLEERGE